ncbi:MAG: T9SS type A sorting domain-containing protein [Ignavibacteriaceae bacterium]|nr:T9SS type A sorting domain-containing protein [Ignavibacteriaceae bacterium]
MDKCYLYQIGVKNFILTLFITALLTLSLSAQTNSYNPWEPISRMDVPQALTQQIYASHYKLFRVNPSSLFDFLKTAPSEEFQNTGRAPYLEIILPSGRTVKFAVYESSIMEAPLQAKYPQIRTFKGVSNDEGIFSARFDFTEQGFHGHIFTSEGTVFIDPFSMGNTEYYMAYNRKDFIIHPDNMGVECLVTDYYQHEETNEPTVMAGTLRTYRLANAATGEYTAFHGGTVALGLSAIVTALNRVNQVYERDMAIRMILIANNDLIIYTNASTDPYTNNNGSTMLGQNVNNLNNVIGFANFDIGHVYSTGGGGVAYLASVCGSNKAGGVTGSPAPVGDPFTIDYVAHEMGHQYGANHTQNNNCNRASSAAYEPGSASTIMGYAGICSPNLQSNSDDYFHIHSMIEMSNALNSTVGSCATQSSTGNTAPVVTMPTGGYVVPISTPMKLIGSATDANNPSSLTYCWEQYDLGPAGSPNTPSGNAPIFRSFKPVNTGTRYLPKLSDVYNNTQTLGEILPSYARNLTFRLTVRDNNPGAGDFTSQLVAYTTTAAAGPFQVTYPNAAGASFPGGSSITATWNVANTNVAPVNVANVNILLTTDAGLTYTMIKTNTPNDGSEEITLPTTMTTTARLVIESINNIFYDVSNANFTITEAIPVELTSFDVYQSESSIVLNWSTATETNNRGFIIEKSVSGLDFAEAGFVDGKGTTTETQSYSFTDRITSTGKIQYRLRQEDYDGTFAYSQAVEVDVALPTELVLYQNHPNPFNPSTSISFNLPFSSDVKIEVFDITGSKVSSLLGGKLSAGIHTINFDASELNSGVYLYILSAVNEKGETATQSKKMMLLK